MKLVTTFPGRDALYACSCGTLFICRKTNADKGKTKSCGCRRSEGTRARNTTHGMFGTPAYSVWNSMVQRCHNPKAQAYANYGGRGITVCDRWRIFENFYADMGEPNGLTLDRDDNTLGYSKENCSWATMKTQQHNKRSNVVLEYQGRSMDVTQWAEHLGVERHLLFGRLKLGWSVERTLTAPKRNKSVGVRKA